MRWVDCLRFLVIDPITTDVAHNTTPLSAFAAPTTLVSFNGQRLTDLAASPSADHDATSKIWVTNLVASLSDLALLADLVKVPVKASATSNLGLSTPGATMDGVTLSPGDRVLLTGQNTGSQNGLWVWNGAAVAMTRPTDFAHASAVLATYGMCVQVLGGTLRAGTSWYLITTGAITIDTTSQTWVAVAPSCAALINDVKVTTAGKGLYVKTGSNAKIGSVGLTTGAAVVANTSITANSVVLTSITALGTVTDPMPLLITLNPGVGFTITSEDATDTSTVAWFVVESIP